MNKYDVNVRQTILARCSAGEAISQISSSTGISRNTIYRWINENNSIDEEAKSTKFREVIALENKVKRLQGIIEIMQKSDCSYSAPLKEKLFALEKLYGQYNVHMLCEALNVSRGTFYNHILRNKRDNTWYNKRHEELKTLIQQTYDDSNQIFGAAKITAVLKERGYNTSEKTVRSIMKELDIYSIRVGAKAMYLKESRGRIKNIVDRQFNPDKPNMIWASDVTYFKFNGLIRYICVVIDLFSRKIVGYKIGRSNSTQLVSRTFKMAFESRKPHDGLILHTDRGGNYVSIHFGKHLRSLGVIQSFSKAGTPYDNSVVESSFANLKREKLYRTIFHSEREFNQTVDDYIEFYNNTRPHASNGNKTPDRAESEYYKTH